MSDRTKTAAIPQPEGMPVIGNMLTVDTKAPLQALMQIAREQGPLFQLNMMGTPLVVASGHEIVHELCDETRFDKAVRGSLRRIRAIGGDGLFTGETQEPNWRKAHNILLPTFSQRAMVNYFPMMLDIATQLMLKWERLNADDEIDVVHDMTAMALDVIGVCGFDYRFNSFYRRDYHPFIDALNRTLETCMKQRGIPFEDVVLRNRLAQMKEDVGYMNKLVDDIIRERKKGGPDAKAPNDLLNYMLAGVDRTTGEGLSDENIRYQINTFLIAGHETTSGLMSFTLYYLLNHPDVLARAQEEVDRVLGRDISVEPTFQQVSQLTYVQQVLKEALRLWPTAPAFGLYPYKDEIVGPGYALKKRTFVTVLTLMLHRDKTVWGENAEAFDPDNFSREAEATRPLNAYKPFGNGQRACIGRQFAMQEAALVIGMILQRFDLVDHRNYKLTVKETLSIKPDGFTLRVKPRKGRMQSTLQAVSAIAATGGTDKAAETPKRASNGVPMLVLYGSNLGATEEIAEKLSNRAALLGFEASLAPLDDFAGKLPDKGGVLIATASYNGAPPDNATRFTAWLKEAPAGSLKGVHFAVFGCGNRDWASTFQATPRLIDSELERAGATRLHARGEGDAREDMDGAFRDWMKGLWPDAAQAFGVDLDASAGEKAVPLYDVSVVEAPGAPASDAQNTYRTLMIRENRELQTGNDRNRSTRHIAIRLADGMHYRPGDHLAVLPINSDLLANRALTHFGFAPDTQIIARTTQGRRSPHGLDGAVSAGRLMKTIVDLQAVATRAQVRTLAEHTRCPKSRPEIEALAAEGGKDDPYRREIFLKRVSVLDLLQRFPACELPFNVFLEMLPSLAPRYYSISSAPQAVPGQLSVTVGVVQGPARSGQGTYRGVCSTYLANLEAGNTIRGVIKETKAGFALPEDFSRPVIMIGPGTGLAPFRGFLQALDAARQGGQTVGPAMLFFGCRHPDEDFLYREELEAWAASGLVDLNTAFSRAGAEKVYVQDLIRRRSADVWRLIEAGAIIYVCGDGSRMEPDVKRALMTIHAEMTDQDAAASEIWIDGMGRENRYVLDVWAGN